MEERECTFREAYAAMMVGGVAQVHLFPINPDEHYAWHAAPTVKPEELAIALWALYGADPMPDFSLDFGNRV